LSGRHRWCWNLDFILSWVVYFSLLGIGCQRNAILGSGLELALGAASYQQSSWLNKVERKKENF